MKEVKIIRLDNKEVDNKDKINKISEEQSKRITKLVIETTKSF